MADERALPVVLCGAMEFADVYDGPARNVAQWIQRGSLDYEEALILSGRAYWTLGFVVAFGERQARPKEPNMGKVTALIAEQAPGAVVKKALAVGRADVPPIVGKQELLAITGEDYNKGGAALTMAIKAGNFPEGDWQLSGSPLWLLDTALAGLDTLRARSRVRPLEVNEEVVRALREGTYEGPGSKVLTRGASKAKE